MDKEQIRIKLIDACATGAIPDIMSVLENNLKEQDDFSNIIFEQAVFKSIASGHVNALNLLLSQENYSVSPMSYSYLFDKSDSNKEILQILCFKLKDIDELKNLYIDKTSQNEAFIKECINTRLEKDIFEAQVKLPTGEGRKFKL